MGEDIITMVDHPINHASEDSPYGDLTREDFYNKHRVHHHQSSFLNKTNMNIFTQSWRPDDPTRLQLRGIVCMIHGYNLDSSWLTDLTAVAIAKAGFHVFALDLQGHGHSDGAPGHVPNIHPLVCDCSHFFNSVRSDYPDLPAFLYGESLGGAIAVLVCLQDTRTEFDGLVLNGAMCGVSRKFRPIWPIEKLLPVAAYLAPKWTIVIAKPPARRSYKERWKARMVANNPNRPGRAKPAAATALEFLRVCECIKKNCHRLNVPMLVLHGGNDTVCDPESARFVYESAACKDKTLKIFPGMWHQLIGEPSESVNLVYGTVISWIGERADRAKK